MATDDTAVRAILRIVAVVIRAGRSSSGAIRPSADAGDTTHEAFPVADARGVRTDEEFERRRGRLERGDGHG